MQKPGGESWGRAVGDMSRGDAAARAGSSPTREGGAWGRSRSRRMRDPQQEAGGESGAPGIGVRTCLSVLWG